MLKYNLTYSLKAKQDLKKYQKSGKKPLLKKLDMLLKELEDHPRTGTGKPERLKGYGAKEIWSRRINDKHRLVYGIKEEVVIVLIVPAYGHYVDE